MDIKIMITSSLNLSAVLISVYINQLEEESSHISS